MKKIIFALVLASIPAFADVPLPRNNVVSTEVKGDAAAIYNSMNVKEQITGMLRTGSMHGKVMQIPHGNTALVCEKSEFGKNVTYNCSTRKTVDGKELPEVVLPVRMG